MTLQFYFHHSRIFYDTPLSRRFPFAPFSRELRIHLHAPSSNFAFFIDIDPSPRLLLHPLDSYPRLQETEMNELHRSAKSRNLKRVRRLVEGGANLEETNEDGDTALMLASEYGHFEIVAYLLEH